MLRRESISRVDWGLNAGSGGDLGLGDPFKIPYSLDLKAITIAPDSQADAVFIQRKGEVELLAFGHPYVVNHGGDTSDIVVRPYQYFDAGIIAATEYDNWNTWHGIDSVATQSIDDQKYGRDGAFLKIHLWYGGLPWEYARRRPTFQRYHTVTIPQGAGANKAVFRNIITGRDGWELSSVNYNGTIGQLTWVLYGYTEAALNVNRQTQLASGTGAIDLQGSRAYDSIVLFAYDTTDAGKKLSLRFTARDW